MKKRPQIDAQARKNMIMYLKNVIGFRLDYFKGMSYDDIRPIFEAKFNSNIEFLLKIKEQLEEEENRAIQSINKTSIQKVAKRRKLNDEVKDLKRHLDIVTDEDDDVYTEATPLARKCCQAKVDDVRLVLLKEELMLLSQVNTANVILMLSKRHLDIVTDEDDDVYTEATPLARKVLVVDYEIIHLNNKPHYKII
nr:hypothetical protein [Tanacetum cinerariifolium]